MEVYMSAFYQNWLKVWAWGVIAFGAILAMFAFGPLESPTRLLFEIFGNPIPEAADQHHRFSIGLMGAVTLGWGLTFLAAFKAAFQLEGQAANQVWRALTMGAIVWYVIDNSISIHTGIWMNAVSNTVLMILFIIPIWKSGVLEG